VDIELIIKEVFTRNFNLPELPWGNLVQHVAHEHYKKNNSIKFVHSVEKNIYLIISGSTASIALKREKEVCLELCYENEFCGDYLSLLTQTATPIEIRALEKTEVVRIPFNRLIEFYQSQSELISERVGRMVAEYLYILKQNQLIDLQVLSAEERYNKLMERQKDVFRRTPLKHIASYLGITPESLSRIRKTRGKNLS
jgi:CRP/FNR family transcriptional regulator, anaerobic regulatory protein